MIIIYIQTMKLLSTKTDTIHDTDIYSSIPVMTLIIMLVSVLHSLYKSNCYQNEFQAYILPLICITTKLHKT